MISFTDGCSGMLLPPLFLIQRATVLEAIKQISTARRTWATYQTLLRFALPSRFLLRREMSVRTIAP